MEDFLEDLVSPSWWVGVVIVGIVINVFSAYLIKPFDSIFRSISTGWRERSESKTKKRNELINKLKSDESLLILFALTENRYRIRSVGFILMGIAFFSGAVLLAELLIQLSIGAFIGSLLLILAGLHDHREAMSVKSIVDLSNEEYKNL